ncbi:hypothetical protein ABND12_12745 [Paenibacillus larvae]
MDELSLESVFGNGKLNIKCSNCKNVFEFMFKDIPKPDSILTCPDCGQNVIVGHDEDTKQKLLDAEKALKDLKKDLNDF